MEYLSQEKYQKLKKELERLEKEEMKKISLRLKAAKEQGDLSENAAYAQAREEEAFLLRRIAEIKRILKESRIFPKEGKASSVVEIGSKIKLRNETGIKIFKIVGKEESDPERGLISYVSPLGKALLGKKAGQKIEIETPAGKKSYFLLEIL